MAARGDLTTLPREGRVFRETPGSGPERDPERSSNGTATPWPALVGFVGLSLLLAAANAAAIPAASESWFLSLAHPPGTQPDGVSVPTLVVISWAVLSLPSGLGAWLAWRRPRHRRALLLWGWHLLACAGWMQALLGFRLPGLAAPLALALLALAALSAAAFARLHRAAGLLMLPTLAWTCYAAYVTAGLWWLNQG
jgi:tryptophan-rich sensory protein